MTRKTSNVEPFCGNSVVPDAFQTVDDHNYSIHGNIDISATNGSIFNTSLTDDLNTPVVESRAFPGAEASSISDVLAGDTFGGKKSALLCDWNTPVFELPSQEDSVPIHMNTNNTTDIELEDNSVHEITQLEEQNPKKTDNFSDYEINWDFVTELSTDVSMLEQQVPGTISVSPETVQQVPGTVGEMSPALSAHDSVVFDYDMASMALKALSSGDVSPLIKEELKCAILAKRIRKGQEQPVIEFKDDDTDDEVTPEIEERRKDRRERNKLAARKCRTKKKEQCDVLQQEIDGYQSKNDALAVDIKKLREEHERLLVLFRTHLGTPLCTHQRA